MGVPEQKLCSQHWQNVHQRMQTEEAACQLAGGEAEENGYVNSVFTIKMCRVNQLVSKLHFSKNFKVRTFINLFSFYNLPKSLTQNGKGADEGLCHVKRLISTN